MVDDDYNDCFVHITTVSPNLLQIKEISARTMKITLNFFKNYLDDPTFKLIKNYTKDKIYIDTDTTKILFNLIFLTYWEDFHNAGINGETIFQIMYNVNKKNERLEFDLISQEMINYKEFAQLLTHLTVNTIE